MIIPRSQPPAIRFPTGSREDPFRLIVPRSYRAVCEANGYTEGAIVALPGGWWRIIFDVEMPSPVIPAPRHRHATVKARPA